MCTIQDSITVHNMSTCNARDLGSIPGLGRPPGEGHGNPIQCSCLENSHGQRSLVGHNPWGCKELDGAEQLSIAQAHVKRSIITHSSCLYDDHR